MQSQPERAGSFRHSPCDLGCYENNQNQSRARVQLPTRPSARGFIWKRPDFSGLARIGFSRAAAVQAQPRGGPVCGSLYPSGSRWLSLQSLSEIGAPTLASLRKGFRGPSMRLHLTNLVVSAASSAPPRSAPAPTSAAPSVSGGSQPASRCPRSRARGPGRGLPRVQGQPVCRCAGGWGGPAQGEEVGLWAQSPPWSSPPGPWLSEGGWAGEPQREEGEGLTIWDGRSRGRRTGAPRV